MKKQGAELITSRVIVLVLILLVIVFVLFLIFKPDILDWIRNMLPEYEYGEDKDIYVPKEEEVKDGCEIWVAMIGDKPIGKYILRTNDRNLYLLEYDEQTEKYTPKITELYLYIPNENEMYIKIKDAFLFVLDRIDPDPVFGYLDNDVIIIDFQAFTNYYGDDPKGERILLTLKILDGAHKKPGQLLFCKSKQEIENQKITPVDFYFAINRIPGISEKNIGDPEKMTKEIASTYYFEEGSNEKSGIMVNIANPTIKYAYMIGDREMDITYNLPGVGRISGIPEGTIYIYSLDKKGVWKWHPFTVASGKQPYGYEAIAGSIGQKPEENENE